MAEDLTAVLARFHRDVLLPDMERILGSAVGSAEQRLRDEMHTVFDALAHRMERLETEFEMLKAGVGRVERKVDEFALKADLASLKSRVADLQEQIAALEARLES